MAGLSTISNMNQTGFTSSAAVLRALKEGRILRFVDLPVLARFEKPLYYVSGPNFTLRLNEEDFLELYGSHAAIEYGGQTEIDPARDEEYYAWRREKQ